MSYTADPRVLFAAERTLLAWQRTTIALMGFGFLVERFAIDAAERSFSLALGIVLMLTGAGVALISARQFRHLIKNLAPDMVPPGYWTNFGVLLNVLLAAISTALAAHFLWTRS